MELVCIVVAALGYFFIMRHENTLLPKQSQITTFYVGYSYGFVHMILLNFIVHYRYAIVFDIALLLGRTFILGIGNWKLYLTNVIIDLVVMLARYKTEETERETFFKFFNYRDEFVKFKHLIASYLPNSIVILDVHKKNLFCNNSFNKIYEAFTNFTMNMEEYLSCFKMTQAHPEDDSSIDAEETKRIKEYKNLRTVFDAFCSKEIKGKYKYHFSLANGEQNRKLFEIKLFWIRWDGCEAVTILMDDITHQETIIALQVADANKDRVIATVSHELRTPINGMLGMLQIMQKLTKDEDLIKHVELCQNAAKLLLNIVNTILDLQLMRANKLRISISKTDIREVLDEVYSLFVFSCKEKGISLELKVDDNVPIWIYTDQNRLKQILINLIGNACKFTFEGGIEIGCEIDEHEDNKVAFWVADTGIGIKEEDTDKLFKVFGKLEDTENINKQGIGLGLTIAYSLVELLNPDGKLEFESKYGQGTKFSFKIFNQKRNIDDYTSVNSSDLTESFDLYSHKEIELTRDFRKHDSKLTSDSVFQNQRFSTITEIDEEQLSISRRNLLSRTKPASITTPSDHLFGPGEYDGNLSPDRVFRKSRSNLYRYHQRRTMSMKEPNILLVDDNPFNLMVAQTLIKSNGFKVKTALNGELAINTALTAAKEGNPFTLVFMDLQMPVMDGYEATKKLKELMRDKELPKAKIFALSANDEDREKSVEAGMDGHLIKPIMEKDLMEAVTKSME